MDKKRALVCVICLYVVGVCSSFPAIFEPVSPFTVISPMALVAAVIMTVVYVRIKKKERKGRIAANCAKFDETVNGDYFAELNDYVERFGINALPEYIKTFLVLWNLYDAMSETGFDEFFVNYRVNGVEELLSCYKIFGNKKLTKICEEAIAQDKINSQNESASPSKSVGDFEELNTRFYALDKKIDLQSLIKDYFMRNFNKKPAHGNKKEYDFEDIPQFRFYDGEAAKKMFVLNGQRAVCNCCGKVGKYIYDGIFYAEQLKTVCPHCIKSGLAHLKFMVEFTDIKYVDQITDESAIREVAYRTPSYNCYQEPYWLSCCDDLCECFGDMSWNEVVERGFEKDVTEAIQKDPISEDISLEELIECIKDGSCSLGVFKCKHCGATKISIDFD